PHRALYSSCLVQRENAGRWGRPCMTDSLHRERERADPEAGGPLAEFTLSLRRARGAEVAWCVLARTCSRGGEADADAVRLQLDGGRQPERLGERPRPPHDPRQAWQLDL